MRTKNATVKFRIRKKQNGDGTFPVMLFISYHGKCELSTGISVNKKHWDATAARVTNKHQNAKMINQTLSDIQRRIEAIRDDFIGAGNYYTADDIKRAYRANRSTERPKTILDTAMKLCDERGLSEGTRNNYKLTAKICKTYGADLLEEYNFAVNNRIFSEMKKRKPSYMRKIIVQIKAILYFAKEKGYIDNNILEKFEPSTIKITYRHKSINKLQINAIRKTVSFCLGLPNRDIVTSKNVASILAPLPSVEFVGIDLNEHEKTALCLFYFGYISGGPALCDLAKLKRDDFKQTGHLLVSDTRRAKTGHPFRIVLDLRDEVVVGILNRFEGLCPDGRLVPLNTSSRTAFNNARQKVNRHLQKAVRKMNPVFRVWPGWKDIPADITFYVSRHSFASVMSDSGCSMANLAEMMGRSINGLSVYIKALGTDEDVANAKLNLL